MKDTAHWFVYMLECENGSYYTGSTDDLERRYDEHRRGTAKSKYTRSFKPVRIARCWKLSGSRGDAMRIEKLIQGMNRKGKNALVADPGTLRDIVGDNYDHDFGIAPYLNESSGDVPEDNRDITRYNAQAGEWKIRNPYLEEILALVATNKNLQHEDLLALLVEARPDFVGRFAFSIPTIGIIEEIARFSPLVEIGAGGGYWTKCLSDAGADIIAYDKRPPGEESPWEWRDGNQWFDDTWFHVQEGDESMAGCYPERALLLCWPPIFDPMAVNALRLFRKAGGKTVIFVGSPGSSADKAFYLELEPMKMVRSVKLWSWPGIDERMMIYDLTSRPPLP